MLWTVTECSLCIRIRSRKLPVLYLNFWKSILQIECIAVKFAYADINSIWCHTQRTLGFRLDIKKYRWSYMYFWRWTMSSIEAWWRIQESLNSVIIGSGNGLSIWYETEQSTVNCLSNTNYSLISVNVTHLGKCRTGKYICRDYIHSQTPTHALSHKHEISVRRMLCAGGMIM